MGEESGREAFPVWVPRLMGDRRRVLSRRSALRSVGACGLLVAGAAVTGAASADASPPAPLISRAVWGAYASREPWPDEQAHFALERLVGVRLPVMSWFMTWSVSWPNLGGRQAAAGRYDLQIAWQPELDDDTPIKFTDIVAGKYDGYLTRFFTKAKQHPGRVTVRFAHEMNGDRYPWSASYTGPEGRCVNSPAEYSVGWRYVVDFKRRMGATNVPFAWCVMSNDKGGIPAEHYYPGNRYAQILSMDIYNGYNGGWQDPAEAISPTYHRLTALSPTKPIWIGEIGCRETTPAERHTKAAWLRELFALTQFPRISTVMFFNAARAYDWRLNSSPAALAVCRPALNRKSFSPT